MGLRSTLYSIIGFLITVFVSAPFAHSFSIHPQLMGGALLGQGLNDEVFSAPEVNLSFLLEPDSDRWALIGPRVSLVHSSAEPLAGTEFYAGGEGVLWLGNALGPGLAADFGFDSQWRVEPFVSMRIKRVGRTSAIALRVGPLYDSRLHWLFKGGLTFQWGGVD